MSDILEFAPTVLLFIIVVLLIIKLVLFPQSSSVKTINRFLYFRLQGIYSSNSAKSKKAKLLQNALSIAILILAVLALLIFMFFG